MTPSIFENELVRRYFSPQEKAFYPVMGKTEKMDADAWDKCRMAHNILIAMQTPIRKGERYLVTHNDGQSWDEATRTTPELNSERDKNWHPNELRLPARFQKPLTCREKYHPEQSTCPNCRYPGQEPEVASDDPKRKHCVGCRCNEPDPPPEKCQHGAGFLCSACWPEPKDAVENAPKRIADLICHWFSNGPVGTPNPDSLEKELRDLVRLAREGKWNFS